MFLRRRGTRVDKIGEVAEEVLEASRADDLNGFAISRSKPDGYRILVSRVCICGVTSARTANVLADAGAVKQSF